MHKQLAERKICDVDGTQWHGADTHMFMKLAEHHLLRSLFRLREVNIVCVHGVKRVMDG